MKKLVFLLTLILAFNVFAKEKYTVYTYHNHSPFINKTDSGLSYDLIKYLNNSSEFSFELKVVPRSRLNYILKPWKNKLCGKIKQCDKNWMVLWVNHKWGFGKDSLDNFVWVPILQDSNVIISSSYEKFNYTKVEDLIGKKLAGMAGHRYVGIDDLVEKGKIKRINGTTEIENLQVVLSNRVDATLLPKSAFLYYQKTNKDFKSLYASKNSHQDYMRNIMTTPKNEKLLKYLKSLNLQSFLNK